ncbi:MAG: flippase [Methylophilaceae bacterium]|nr:flippase [Methylophilaceae bacterium]
MISRLKNLTNRALTHQGFLRYFANTSWLFGEKILRMIVGLFVGVWVARYLGPERLGLFSYAQSFVGLFVVIAGLGLDGILVRELVKDESKRDALLGTAFRLKLIGAFLALIALAIAVNLSRQDSLTALLIFTIASATVFQSFNVIDYYFQAKVLSKYMVYPNIISLLISSMVKIWLILNDAPLLHFAYSILFDSFVLACGFLYFYRHKKHLVSQWFFDKKLAWSLLKDSWPLILSGLAISTYMKVDQIMIKEMISVEAVGQYAVAVTISEGWYFIPMVIATSLFPAIISAKKQSKALYYARLQKLYDLMVWIAIAIALPMTYLSELVVSLLYGEQFNQAGSVLMIHIWAGVFVFLGVASSKWFISENLQMLAFWRTFYGMVANVALNLLLIPIYGIQGAAMSTLLSYFIAGLMFDLFHEKTRATFFMKVKTLNLKRYI